MLKMYNKTLYRKKLRTKELAPIACNLLLIVPTPIIFQLLINFIDFFIRFSPCVA